MGYTNLLSLVFADMHAKPVVDRSSVWEEDGSPDSASRVPNIGDIDMSTVNRVLYQVGSPPAGAASYSGTSPWLLYPLWSVHLVFGRGQVFEFPPALFAARYSNAT